MYAPPAELPPAGADHLGLRLLVRALRRAELESSAPACPSLRPPSWRAPIDRWVNCYFPDKSTPAKPRINANSVNAAATSAPIPTVLICQMKYLDWESRLPNV